MGLFAPPRLEAFLDFGGDLAAFPAIDGLAEAVVARRRLNTPEQNDEVADLCCGYVEHWLRGEPTPLDCMLDGGGPTQVMLTTFAWAAECYRNPALAERFERAIPQDLYLEHIEWVGERKTRAAS